MKVSSTDGGTPFLDASAAQFHPWYHIPARYVLVIWGHLGLILVYAMRVNLSIAAEKMQDQFGWTNATKGFVLSAFFIGYALGQIPGGWIATRYGGKWVFGIGVLATAVLTLLLPLASCGTALCPPHIKHSNLVALDVLRVLMGFFESVTYPALYSLFCKWAPASERSRMVSWTSCGAQVGTALAFPIAAWLASLRADDELSASDAAAWFERWPGVFYFFGVAGLAWFAGWSLFVFSDPQSHPRLAADELAYLERTVKITPREPSTPRETPNPRAPARCRATQHARLWQQGLTARAARRAVPSSLYVECFRNKPALAIFANHFVTNWCLYLMLTARRCSRLPALYGHGVPPERRSQHGRRCPRTSTSSSASPSPTRAFSPCCRT